MSGGGNEEPAPQAAEALGSGALLAADRPVRCLPITRWPGSCGTACGTTRGAADVVAAAVLLRGRRAAAAPGEVLAAAATPNLSRRGRIWPCSRPRRACRTVAPVVRCACLHDATTRGRIWPCGIGHTVAPVVQLSGIAFLGCQRRKAVPKRDGRRGNGKTAPAFDLPLLPVERRTGSLPQPPHWRAGER